jgi:hypothetical protein
MAGSQSGVRRLKATKRQAARSGKNTSPSYKKAKRKAKSNY